MKIIPFFLISLLLLSFLSSTLSQPQSEDESDAQTINQEEVESQNDGKFNEAQINSMRTRTMSCILFTKHKIYSIQKELGGILEGYSSKQSEQNSLYRKIFSEMLENCYGHISDQEGQKFMEEVQKKEFNVEDFDHLVETFKLEKFKGTPKTVIVEMTEIQKQLFKYAEEFDKVMKDKQEKEEEEQAEQEKLTPDDYEPKIAGLSLKNSPAFMKYGYLFAIFALFGVIIFWG